MTDPRPTFDPTRIVELDLRDLTTDAPLADTLLAHLRRLPPEGVLHLRTRAPTTTLVAALGSAFAHHATMFDDDDHSTWLWRDGALRPAAPAERADASWKPAPDAMDLRGLAPPEPMLRIVARLERADDDFDVVLPWFPTPLVPVAARYGYLLRTLSEGRDGVRVRVARDPATPCNP